SGWATRHHRLWSDYNNVALDRTRLVVVGVDGTRFDEPKRVLGQRIRRQSVHHRRLTLDGEIRLRERMHVRLGPTGSRLRAVYPHLLVAAFRPLGKPDFVESRLERSLGWHFRL